MPPIELYQYLESLEESFLNGDIPYERYAATIQAYQTQTEQIYLQEEN